MNFKNKALIVILALTMVLSISAVSAVDYSIPSANFDLIIHDNGLINVNEIINYHFDSSANGVYRTILLKDNQSINNIKISAEGAYVNYELLKEGKNLKIKIYLYADKELTKKISSDTDVKIVINYDFNHVTKRYLDTGELHYILWGKEWDKSVGEFTASVRYPTNDKIRYWINPISANANSKWANKTLFISAPDGVQEGDYLELRSVIPLKEFANNTPYAQYINKKGLDDIIKKQNDYISSVNTTNSISNIVSVILVLLCFIPLGIYLKWGREPNIIYEGIYEREPPSNDSPAFINAMMSGIGNDVGDVDIKAFQATIMDLINRGNLGIDIENDTEHTKSTILIVKSTEGLERYEKQLINILESFEVDGRIDLNYMERSLRNEYAAERFSKQFDNWCDEFKENYVDNVLDNYFDSTGSTFMKVFGLGALVLGILVAIGSLSLAESTLWVSLILGILFAIVGGVSLILPSTVGGKWTEEGKLFSEKWINFRKFLNDFSLIKEHPPESIAIWNKYLVYATALGVADSVHNAMKMHVYANGDDYSYRNNDLYMFYYFGGCSVISSSYDTCNSTLSSSNDSVGDIGGGSGGGGGGAF